MKKSLLRVKSRSFTLIEILVAAAIFAVALTVMLISMTSVFKSRSKGEVQKLNQEAARQAVETIANEVKRADVRDDFPEIDSFHYFQILNLLDAGSNNVPDGPRLMVKKYNSDGTESAKIFGLYNQSNTKIDKDCPASDQCYVGFLSSVSSNINPITSTDVNVTHLEFTGYYQKKTDPSINQAPYVTINMKVESKYQSGGKAEEQDVAEFKTTVAPNNNIGQGGTITAHLFVDPDHNGTYEDKGNFIETAIGTSGGKSTFETWIWAGTNQNQPFWIDRPGGWAIIWARLGLLDQRPEMRLISSTGDTIATAHIFQDTDLDGNFETDRGIFIETSLDISGGGQRCQASWTAFDKDNAVMNFNQKPGSDGTPNPPDCPLGISQAWDWLVAEEIRVKFVTPDPDRRILGNARLYAEGIDQGDFLSSSAGFYRDDNAAEAHWLAIDDQSIPHGNEYLPPSLLLDDALNWLAGTEGVSVRLNLNWSYND